MDLNRTEGGVLAGGGLRAAAIADVVSEILAACRSMTGLPYDGEPVDQLEHALQCAALGAAERARDDEYVVACLLHDIARAPAVAGVRYDAEDEHHGAAGSRWLTPRVGTRVAWLAEQHVDAKRYLVATDERYRERLSPVSLMTLERQGGAMSAEQIASFTAHPDWREAVSLRLIDDQAKVPGLDSPALASYRGILAAVVTAHR